MVSEDPEEFLKEMARLDRCVEDLQEYRRNLRELSDSSQGWARFKSKLNLTLSEKQIVRNLRYHKIQRERLEQHYERLRGEKPPRSAWDRRPE